MTIDTNGQEELPERVVVPTTLYTFGNYKMPRTPRRGIDIEVDEGDLVKPTNPRTGASCFGDVQVAPLTGHYHKLEKNTQLPEGLNIVADGQDVGGTHLPIDHTISPSREMPFTEFTQKFLASRWSYGGKKFNNPGDKL